MYRFDHCAHGIEVVSRVEQEYLRSREEPGLNLTFDVRDGILKHMFDPSTTTRPNKLRPWQLPPVVRYPAYQGHGVDKGSLEAQCVYFADKMAYMLADTEDAVRRGIFAPPELQKDPFVQAIYKKYKHLRGAGEDLELANADDFLWWRGVALTVLILDAIDTARKRIEEASPRSVDDVLHSGQRYVWLSDEMKGLCCDFQRRWMIERLYVHQDVIACNLKARHIINDLFDVYFPDPGLIRKPYRDACRKAYQRIGLHDADQLRLLTVTNYIAGMTDAYAIDRHAALFMSTERIRFS